MSTQRESRRSVDPILHIWASKLSFFILILKLKWVGFISHFMHFRNVDIDLPKMSELFWTPVLSRYGDQNLTSWKNHLVHLWPTSFIRENYVQLPQQNSSRTPLRRLCKGRWRKHEVFPSCAHVVFDHYLICYSNWYKTTIMSHCLFQN